MSNPPISAKVSSGTLLGAAVGVLTWALTAYIPAWHHGLPSPVAAGLPVVLSAVGYFVGGWLAKHSATANEVQTALNEAKHIVGVVQAATSQATTTGTVQTSNVQVQPTSTGGAGAS